MSTELPMPQLPRTNEGKRICQVIRVKPEQLDEYKKVRAPARAWRRTGRLRSRTGRLHVFWTPSNSLTRQVHAAVWPEVLGALRKAHVVGQ